jgi:hypothetical protein
LIVGFTISYPNTDEDFVQSPNEGIELFKTVFSSTERFKKDLEDLLKQKGVDKVIREFALEEEKHYGLYVDYKDGKFSSPKSIGKNEAISNLADVKRSFRRMKEYSKIPFVSYDPWFMIASKSINR